MDISTYTVSTIWRVFFKLTAYINLWNRNFVGMCVRNFPIALKKIKILLRNWHVYGVKPGKHFKIP
jgi:hypothetical protein